ncbi:MAG: Tex-like N-terminal domain-containing protein [Chitinivibrionales bacterium]|nr:Tex-like N-terminal domain-containing protein [Chitinivibrionales bacterium]
MIQFAKHIVQTYGISEPLAQTLCACFVKGDTPYYCSEYIPAVAAEMESDQVWDIFEFLREADRLPPKKKRLISILQKDGKLTNALQQRIDVCTDPFELDDLLLPLRPNPRSKAQLALKKGLGDLAAALVCQQDKGLDLPGRAGALVGTEASLKSAEDVLAGVKDILAERFAYDETVRAMTRDFVLEDGFFEISVRHKTDEMFAEYAGKQLPIAQCSKEQILSFLSAEEQKRIRCKISVQLFRITELLRHHCIVDPDAAGFDLICEAIDESWLRLLQPIVERDVKERLARTCVQWALKTMAADLRAALPTASEPRTMVIAGVFENTALVMVACNNEGRLIGATQEKITPGKSAQPTDRLRQFITRHRPAATIVLDNSQNAEIEALLGALLGGGATLKRIKAIPADAGLAASPWVMQHCANCDDNIRLLYAVSLRETPPLQIVSEIGTSFFTIHPLQVYLTEAQTTAVIRRIRGVAALQRGILPADFFNAVERLFTTLSADCLKQNPAKTLPAPLTAKDNILSIAGMTEALFRNVAGFVVIPDAPNPLDRTLMHPDHFEWINSLAQECRISA